jgi:outer membrane protein assembly factor BamB
MVSVYARIGLAVLTGLVVVAGCGGHSERGTWPLPGADLAGTRSAVHSSITASNVARLRPRWRYRLRAPAGFAGLYASTPVVDGDTAYVEDLRSNVFALDRSTGSVRWAHHYNARNDGPNGLAVDGGRVYGATDADAFALAAVNGRELWRIHLTNRTEQFVDIAPVPWQGLVFVSTIGYAPGGRGAIYALDAATGRVRWRFDTIAGPWPHPDAAGGGGLWYPVSIDDQGRLYAGTANPTPWGGTPRFPNGAAFPGSVPYTDTLLVLDARTGRFLWHDQVTPHDIRDYDFQATPIVVDGTVVGAGKAGRVIAWDAARRRRLWSTSVGLHRMDHGPLPRRRVTVCPGLLGGVETPMASAGGRVFVPVVDLCGWGSAIAHQQLKSVDPLTGKGRLVALDAATGRVLWQRRLPAPDFGCATVANDVVVTATYDGRVYAFATETGVLLWRVRLRAGINSCPAIAGDQLFVGAGVKLAGRATPEVVAFSLGRVG